MLTNRSALILLAAWALSALASPIKPLVVQDSIYHLATNDICLDTESDPSQELVAAQVFLDDGVVVGFQEGAADKFLGIPFAEPPTGQRRLRGPEPIPPYEGLLYAQKFGKSCPQQELVFPKVDSQLLLDIGSVVGRLYEKLTPDDEDCLTINVVRPSGTKPGSKLPVVVWIFGGGFELGGTSTYDGGVIVSRSIELGEPCIFVSMNYRPKLSNLLAFGFLPGREVKEAKIGNLGLQDQRLALKWIQTYISEFGGDPSKVTIWGESAGAISVSLHMLTNKGNQEGLFRGAIMQSGGPIPVGDIENGQQYYDFMVERTGCRNHNDTLECLRKVPYSTFKHAMDESPNFFAYQGLVLAWLPRVDGVFLTEPPQHAVLRGHVSNVPMITGNCDDEGSLFSISTKNISTSADMKDYLKLYMMPKAKDAEIDLLMKYYPDDQRAGSPFDTGLKNALSPQFKRTAALQGDFVFHGPRRFFLKQRASKQNSWGFIWKRVKSTPFLGTAHATDLVNSIIAPGELMDYVIHFTSNLNPNGKKGLGIPWPQWNPRDPKAIVLQDSTLFPVVIGNDNYRSDPLDYVANMSLVYPI
ncbi:carotenoid ester lipase precursor [Multifurca ochricompacta]|uniref:Carboxylic ester hydrolase n=1 Tax=Multifurca ochricompacta TaxID=376703 RepID=A0AAD4M0V2_9AGAM|nr:carotenoid ester lipase precursor [Multifurca ochricompacta]